MQAMTDRLGNIQAYLDNYVILEKEHDIVLGVRLGDLIFGHEGNIIGRISHGLLYNNEGEIVARLLTSSNHKIINENSAELNQQAWTIASRVKNHSGPWIEPSTKWSNRNLTEIL